MKVKSLKQFEEYNLEFIQNWFTFTDFLKTTSEQVYIKSKEITQYYFDQISMKMIYSTILSFKVENFSDYKIQKNLENILVFLKPNKNQSEFFLQ